MSLHKIQVFEYSQNDSTFLSLVMPLSILVKISEVLIYGIDPDGYQRQPNSVHFNRIKKFALTQNPQDFILPTSIILGADLDEIKLDILSENGFKYLTIDDSKIKYRIVDGQHRIFGLKEAMKVNSAIGSFPLNVVIVLTSANNRSKELQIFTDINSKGKRINTDLALLAKFDYQIKENKIAEKDINQHIAVKAAYALKETRGENVWQNAIKFDIHSEVTVGIIGVTIFSESIKVIIDQYIEETPYRFDDKIFQGQHLIQYCLDASDKVSKLLFQIWNEIIKVKWKGAFKEDFIKNDEGELVKIFYNKDFYIQKGLGIKSLNPIIGEVIKEHGFNQESVQKSKDLIFSSKVKIEDWRNGGPFSGFNSESGFSKIKQVILNNTSLPSNVNPDQIPLF